MNRNTMIVVLAVLITLVILGIMAFLAVAPANGQVCLYCPPDRQGASCLMDDYGRLYIVHDPTNPDLIPCCWKLGADPIPAVPCAYTTPTLSPSADGTYRTFLPIVQVGGNLAIY